MKWTTPRRRKLLRSVVSSLVGLAASRRRTLLGTSGLLVGVAAVIAMTAVGAGAERRVIERVRAMGTDLLVVSAAPAPRLAGRARQAATLTTLRIGDASALADEARHARAVAPVLNWPAIAHAGGRNVPVAATATTPEGLTIRNMRPASGRLFHDDENRERRRVALLGRTAAANLFGEADPLGQTVRIGRIPVEIVGVLEARGTDPGGADLDNLVVLPLETGMRRVLNIPYVHAVYVQARSGRELEALEAEVRAILEGRLGGRAGLAEPVIIQNQAVLLRTERGAARSMGRLIVATAALALLVGGVGILGVMLLSVRERTREIGLRRAVGAREGDIRLQFLLESALLATAGGIAGVATGVLAAVLAAIAGPWDLVLSWPAPLLGVLASAGLGLAAGVLPATRAARLQPIEALRSA